MIGIAVTTWIVLGNLLGFVWVRSTNVRPWDRTAVVTNCTICSSSAHCRLLSTLLLPLLLGFIHVELTHLVRNVVGLLCLSRILSAASGIDGTMLGTSYLLGSWAGLHAGRSRRGTFPIGASAGVAAWIGLQASTVLRTTMTLAPRWSTRLTVRPIPS